MLCIWGVIWYWIIKWSIYHIVSVAQRSTMQAYLLLACCSILCQLFSQDWPNLHWGRFNNDEVNSINTLQVTILWQKLKFSSIHHFVLRCCDRLTNGFFQCLCQDPSAQDQHELVRLCQGHSNLGKEAWKGNGNWKDPGKDNGSKYCK